jgi:pimeloyl-ACP methyl ester carboxylesterase
LETSQHILKNAGHQVIAVQLPLHSLADDVAATKRAVEQLGGPTILVGHSYGGFVITNAAYNNPNVTGLVYIAALAPDEGESLNDYVKTWPKDFLKTLDNIKPDSGGFLSINQEKFRESFAQDVNGTEADIMGVVQKPPNQSIFAEKSGPPAWKQLPEARIITDEEDWVSIPDYSRPITWNYCRLHPNIDSIYLESIEHHCKYKEPEKHKARILEYLQQLKERKKEIVTTLQ